VHVLLAFLEMLGSIPDLWVTMQQLSNSIGKAGSSFSDFQLEYGV
jgi:hypothetical protein